MAPYVRVLPRDLFNEAKLLKCIGRLVLLIEDGLAPDGLTYEYDGGPFEIVRTDCGHLIVTNITFLIGDAHLSFKTVYNSKANYPLLLEADEEVDVFKDDGYFTKDFFDACKAVN